MELPNFNRLVQVVRDLRNPEGGCPWDLKQTHKSLLKYLLEESYEFIQATENEDYSHMEEELGDVLLQVLLHSVIAEQDKKFDLESVSKVLADKLIRRHPHVFENPGSDIDAQQVTENWEKIKTEEKGEKKRYIDDSLLNFPALFSANKIGVKTQKIQFDWDDAAQVAYKVEEEWQELKEEIAPSTQNHERLEEEMGDFLFSSAQLARHLGIEPEEALRKANKKFIRRFKQMEQLIIDNGKSIDDMNQKEMDVYWDQAKMLEKEK